MTELPVLGAKDFKSDQEVRWCPGCGDYAILAALQSFMPELDVPKELDELVLRCLEKDPARRPGSIHEVMQALRACPGHGDWTAEMARGWWAVHVQVGEKASAESTPAPQRRVTAEERERVEIR